ncbi:hypothetical protein E2320_022542 [Naja naja]|nr:hypothetical protein E2320_022542 [Naja naja]
MHRRHCQPVKVNIKRVAALPTKCLMWSREEDEALCWHADHLWKTGMLKKELLTLLLPHFPDLPAQSSASTSASGSHPATTWMTTLLEVAALNLREDKMGAHELSEIARDLLSREISQTWGRALLQDHTQCWFPHTWRPSKPRPTDITHHWSKCSIHRANYASIQWLYKL